MATVLYLSLIHQTQPTVSTMNSLQVVMHYSAGNLEIWIISFFFFVGRCPCFFLFHTVLMLNVYRIYFIILCLSKIHNPTVTRTLLKAQWRRYAQNGTLSSTLGIISSAVPLPDKYSSNSKLQIHASQTLGWEPASTVTHIQQMCHAQKIKNITKWYYPLFL